MPKEWTHWFLADRVRGSITDRATSELISKHRNLYLVGSVSPDTLYYLRRDDAARSARKAADRIHGTSGENTYEYLNRIAVAAAGPQTDAVAAFAAGTVAHILADATFHPVVYYFCGHENRLHWTFETALDCYVRGTYEAARTLPLSYRTLIRRLEVPRVQLLSFLTREFSTEDVPLTASVMRRAMRSFSRLEGLFTSPAGYRLVRLLGSFSRAAADLRRLFYSGVRDVEYSGFGGSISYRHPVTGVAETTSVAELIDRFVGRANREIPRVVEAIRGPNPVAAVHTLIEEMPGPSLETGLPPGSPFDLRYSEPTKFDTLLPAK